MRRLALMLLALAVPAGPAAADVRVFSANAAPAGDVWLDVAVADGQMALEAYAGDRHRQIGQGFVAPASTPCAAFTMTVGNARNGARGAAVRVELAQVDRNDVGGGRVLAEGVGRLPDELPDGLVVGFKFDRPATLRAGESYAIRLKFLESAPGRAVAFRVGRPQGKTSMAFLLSTDEQPWEVADGRSVEMRLYGSLSDDAVAFVPRRIEDVEPRFATVELVADLPADAPLAQPQDRPDVFDVHGIWHASGGEQRMAQTFAWQGGDLPDGVLVRVRDFSEPYHGGLVDAPFELAIVETRGGDGPTGEPIGVWRGTLPDRLRHSAYLRVGVGELPLKAGATYALHLMLPESAPRRHLSLSAATGDPLPSGQLYRSQNGNAFVPIEDADLTFALTRDAKETQ